MKRLTFAACETHLEQANDLFYSLFGERDADLDTFTQANYTDGNINYALASCPISTEQEAMIPETIEGCMYRIDINPQEAISDMGLTLIETEGLIE